MSDVLTAPPPRILVPATPRAPEEHRAWWDGQRGMNEGLFGQLLPPDIFEQRQELAKRSREVVWNFDPHAGQQPVLACDKRYIIVDCGRRWGKSLLAVRWAVDEALRTQGKVWLCGPTYATAMRALYGQLIAQLPRPYRKVTASARRIDLTGGGVIEVVSLDNPDNLRGEGLAAAVIDEAAFTTDYAVEQVIRPMLLQTQGRLLAISTPNGRKGWFYRWWLRGQSTDAQDQRYWSVQAPSWTNPFIPEEEWDELRANTPENVFAQEYGAEFVDSTSQVFRNVQIAATAQRRHLVEVGEYFVGIDFARSGDYTVVSVLQKLDGGRAKQVEMERWHRIDDLAQVARIEAIIDRFKPRKVLAEKNSFGAVSIALLQRKGVAAEGFNTSGSSKGPLIQQLAGAFEFRNIDLLDDAVQTNELLSYERNETANMTVTYNAPAGYHDDTVIALALAWRAGFGDPEGVSLGGHFEGEAKTYEDRDTIVPAMTWRAG